MLGKEVSDHHHLPGLRSRWGGVGAGGEEVLIDVFCQEPFEVGEEPTSQTLNGLKAIFPTSCWR